MSKDLKRDALAYHAEPTPGKISIELTTNAETLRELSLAYSPGVAAPCREIAHDPALAYSYTGIATRNVHTRHLYASIYIH